MRRVGIIIYFDDIQKRSGILNQTQYHACYCSTLGEGLAGHDMLDRARAGIRGKDEVVVLNLLLIKYRA